MLLSKIDFKLNLSHLIFVKKIIHQENIIILNIYAPNFIKQILLDVITQIDLSVITVGNLNVSLSGKHWSFIPQRNI